MKNEMLSLYDYLGRPAGGELGKEVAAYAKLKKQPFTQKEISIPTYKGKIQMYSREFLDSYFQKHEREDTLPQDTYDGGLPF